MDHALAGVVGWQSVLAGAMAAATLVMMRWFSLRLDQQAQERTVRVVSKYQPARRARSRRS